jgi:glycosyltransferase involved in cell wall biosynthesis
MEARVGPGDRDGPLTSIVFPTYNPGSLIERTWREVSRFRRQEGGNWEILFVCDGCTDGTPERLTEWTAEKPGIARVLSYSPNRGKGYAVRHGLALARGQYRIFADVDLAYDFADIVRLAKTLWWGADIAIASRTHQDSTMLLPTSLQGYAYRRSLQSLVFSGLVRLLLPLHQRDTQAGLKGMSARAAETVLPTLRCDGFGFDCELLTAGVRLGFSIQEVPVCIRFEGKQSTTGFRSMARMIKDLWKIRRAWRRFDVPPAPATDAGRRRAA